jgi:hypothetical protein
LTAVYFVAFAAMRPADVLLIARPARPPKPALC